MNGRAMKLRVVRGANGTKHRSRRAGDVNRRRGVILLVVLALLTLFALMTMTFILVASQARRTAQASTEAEQHGDAPQELLDMAAKQVLRGTNNPLSVLRPHSLLEDIYGNEVIRAKVDGAINTVGNGQIWEFSIATTGLPLDSVNDSYSGRVITFVSGNLAGTSTRILRYRAAPATLRVLAPIALSSELASQDEFIVNGQPFSGTGFGFDPTNLVTSTNPYPLLNATISSPPINGLSFTMERALLPNARFFSPSSNYEDAAGAGGANEDYDAPDYQNLLLAMQISDSGTSIYSPSRVGMPSLHRPDLVNYWVEQLATFIHTNWGTLVGAGTPTLDEVRRMILRPWGNDNIPSTGDDLVPNDDILQLIAFVKRQILLRPILEDHPNFTGSNPAWYGELYNDGARIVDNELAPSIDGLSLLHGAWDVDNDGDGVADSVWVDLGFPAQTSADGRQYKPLFAILCLDLDGKLNLNAHGSPSHYVYDNSATPPAVNEKYQYAQSYEGPFAGAPPDPSEQVTTRALPPGGGFSVADANLASILPSPYLDATNTINEYRRLLEGQRADDTDEDGEYEIPAIPGRYGETHLLYESNDNSFIAPRAGLTAGAGWQPGPDGEWGNAGVNDNLSGELNDVGQAGWPQSDDLLSSLYGDDNMPSSVFGSNNVATSPVVVTAPGDSVLDWRGNFFNEGMYFDTSGTQWWLPTSGTPVDLNGKGAVLLDVRGQPIFSQVGTPHLNRPFSSDPIVVPDAVDEPAEIDLTFGARLEIENPFSTGQIINVDQAFSLEELEPLLRPRDIDAATLSDNRIQALAPLAATNDYLRGLMTTDSWDMPVPSAVVTPEIRRGLQDMGVTATAAVSMVDLLRGKIRAVNSTLTNEQVTTLAHQLIDPSPSSPPRTEIVAPELLAGHRMDLNRPFGNNRDDNNNGAIDDPSEVNSNPLLTEQLWEGSVSDNGSALPTDNNNDGAVNDRDKLGRYRYAKHLFVLLMLLRQENLDLDLAITDWYADLSPTEGLSSTDRKELTIRKLAQWSINVADFRDSDSIMTPFEYDVNPFDGWDVDGDVATIEGTSDRRVVWGCESPELLLTEAVAFHDRRTEDLSSPNGLTTDMSDPDVDFDQARVPQGSAFVELYCTRNPNNPYFSRDLYDASGNLELGKMAPSSGGIAMPVWRIAVSNSRQASADNDVQERLVAKMDSTSLQPEQFSLLNGSTEPDVDVERIVWFTNTAPTSGTPDFDKIYYNRGSTSPLLPMSQYAVVGPHRTNTVSNTTWIGSDADSQEPQQIDLMRAPGHVFVTRNGFPDNYPTVGTSIKTPLGIGVAGGGTPIGFSISEPVFSGTYYPTPDATSTLPDGTTVTDRYTNAADRPFDDDVTIDSPLRIDNLPVAGSVLQYKNLFLQRLANPLMAWHADTNPYVTVDWIPCDLTIFNSEEASAEPSIVAGPLTATRLETRERGQLAAHGDRRYHNPWFWLTEDPSATTPNQPLNHFGHELVHTLGYLNAPFHDGTAVTPWLDNSSLPDSNPYATDPNDIRYVGEPRLPFPWITWNNRPFASGLELLLVPSSSAPRLFIEHSTQLSLDGAEKAYPQRLSAVTSPTAPVAEAELDVPSWPYGHLLNFFFSSDVDGEDPTGDPLLETGSDFYRLFEFVHVPSRFSGTSSMLDPREFNATSAEDLYPFYAPFNRVSSYREPGRVNLNTVFDRGNILRGVMNGFDEPIINPWTGGDLWGKVVQSRKGYPDELVPSPVVDPLRMLEFNASSPTVFTNPFRSFGNTYNVPLAILRTRVSVTPPEGRTLVEGTILRPDPDPTDPSDATRPLFAPKYETPLTDDFRNTDRNPYFRYHALQKLGNLVTTRSNVYAVWITVGFFEVEQGSVDAGHPDGYRLGRELGIETGEVRRHRAFYVFDRTVPVGFERGEDHNVERAVRLRRFIE